MFQRCALPPSPRLRSSAPDEWKSTSLRRRGWWLVGLFVLCLVSRSVMAWRIGPVCNDGYYYVSVAAAFETGDLSEAFAYLNLNVYPLILLSLHRLGLDWVVAGKLWGVLVASLTVLPLFGWVRRIYGDRVGLAAGLLYAVHPELTELSVEPFRDPTFWLLMSWSVYLSWRATQEGRWRHFLLGGVVTALAIHTRTEGWLLVLPFACWSLARVREGQPVRRLVSGGLAWTVATPVLILLVNVTCLHGKTEWKFGRLEHFALGWQRVMTLFTEPSSARDSADRPARPVVSVASVVPLPTGAVTPAKRSSTSTCSARPHWQKDYVRALVNTVEPINFTLLIIGLVWARTSLRRGDQHGVLSMAVALLVAVAVVHAAHGGINGRYFLPVYLILIPFAGMGLLLTVSGMSRWLARRLGRPGLRRWGGGVAVTFALVLGWGDAWTTWHETREAEAAMGRWLNEQVGPFESVAVNGRARRAGYYAFGKMPAVLPAPNFPEGDVARQTELLIFGCERVPIEQQECWRQSAAAAGFTAVSYESPPMAAGRFLVFRRFAK